MGALPRPFPRGVDGELIAGEMELTSGVGMSAGEGREGWAGSAPRGWAGWLGWGWSGWAGFGPVGWFTLFFCSFSFSFSVFLFSILF